MEEEPEVDEYFDAAWPSILLDGFALVHGDRGRAYGPVWEDYQRVTNLFNSLWGDDVLDVNAGILFMICMKLSRIAHGLESGFDAEQLKDSITDAAGYLDCLYGSLLNPAPIVPSFDMDDDESEWVDEEEE
jgi:cytochrome c